MLELFEKVSDGPLRHSTAKKKKKPPAKINNNAINSPKIIANSFSVYFQTMFGIPSNSTETQTKEQAIEC
jgi:hypothetical protein